jgi:hypothetical protein
LGEIPVSKELRLPTHLARQKSKKVKKKYNDVPVYFDTAVRSHEDGVHKSFAFQLVIPLLPHLQLFQLKRWAVINPYAEYGTIRDRILFMPHPVPRPETLQPQLNYTPVEAMDRFLAKRPKRDCVTRQILL